MFSKSMYQEELRQIGDAISAIQCLSNEENEETKADKRLTTYDGYVHMIEKYIYPYFKEKGFPNTQYFFP